MTDIIGIDVGGTSVKIALVSKQGKIIYQNKAPTQAAEGYAQSSQNIKDLIKKLLQDTNKSSQDIKGIGIGFPGLVDSNTGVVKFLANMPGWDKKDIANQISNEFGLPVKIGNDANCAALAEWKCGAGVGCTDVVCITIGTGVGGGIIANGALITGFNNAAGELGHIKISNNANNSCGCGDTDCLEAYASGTGMTKLAQSYGLSVENPLDIYNLAKQGNQLAIDVFAKTGEYIGLGLVTIIHLLNPQKIIIGGGVAQAGDLLFDPIKQTIKNRSLKVSTEGLEVVAATMGNDAGVVGASLLID